MYNRNHKVWRFACCRPSGKNNLYFVSCHLGLFHSLCFRIICNRIEHYLDFVVILYTEAMADVILTTAGQCYNIFNKQTDILKMKIKSK